MKQGEGKYKTIKYKQYKFIIPTINTIKDYPIEEYIERCKWLYGGVPVRMDWIMETKLYQTK